MNITLDGILRGYTLKLERGLSAAGDIAVYNTETQISFRAPALVGIRIYVPTTAFAKTAPFVAQVVVSLDGVDEFNYSRIQP